MKEIKNSKLYKYLSSFDTLKYALSIIILTAIILIGYSAFYFYKETKNANEILKTKAKMFVQLADLSLQEPLWEFDFGVAENIANSFFKDSEISYVEIISSDGHTIFKKHRNEKSDLNHQNLIIDSKQIIKTGFSESGSYIDHGKLGTVKIGLTKKLRQNMLHKEFLRYLIIVFLILFLVYNATRALFKIEKDNKHTLETILNNLADSVMLLNSDLTIKSFNKKIIKNMFGYNENEITKKHIDILFKNPDSVYKIKKNGKVKFYKNTTNEIYGIKKDLTEFQAEINIGEVYIHNKLHYILAVRDITQRNEINRIKSEFISVVSHELRTPLTSIIGSLKLVLSGSLGSFTEPAKKLLKIADNNSTNLLSLINNILDIDKLQKGQMTFDIEALNINMSIKEVIQNNEIFADQYNVNYKFLPENEVLNVLADKIRINQILTNLLSNAAKYSFSGEEVLINSSIVNNTAKISVINKGEPIPDEAKKYLFNKFTQIDSSSTRAKGGSGLGLNICMNLIKKMNGKIDFNSDENGYTTFYFNLPLSQPEE